jgi:CDP-6-deoxy-D-xylo-4-hexulose-3-dehydrase
MHPTSIKRYALAERTIDEADLGELIDWLKTNPQLTQGPLVKQFESTWSAWLGRKHSVFVNSGSSANLIMYYALLLDGRLKNNKVIVPAAAWATTVAPAIQLGFEPIMCESDWQTFGLDLKHLEQLCEEHDPGAVIVVQTLGVPGNMDGLLALKAKYGFALMEDACPATGSTYKDLKVGSFGDMASFSFYFGHHLSTIEGGMVSTDDDRLYELLLHIRSHGWAKDLSPEKEAELADAHGALPFNRIFTFYYPGFNVRATDLQARIGLSQMRKADAVCARRVENQARYEQRFANSIFHVPHNPDGVTCSISFVALTASTEHRDRIAEVLRANNVETRPLGGGSMGRQPFWAERYGARAFPVADAIHTRSFMLPNNPDISLEDVDHIAELVLSIPAEVEGQKAA